MVAAADLADAVAAAAARPPSTQCWLTPHLLSVRPTGTRLSCGSMAPSAAAAPRSAAGPGTMVSAPAVHAANVRYTPTTWLESPWIVVECEGECIAVHAANMEHPPTARPESPRIVVMNAHVCSRAQAAGRAAGGRTQRPHTGRSTPSPLRTPFPQPSVPAAATAAAGRRTLAPGIQAARCLSPPFTAFHRGAAVAAPPSTAFHCSADPLAARSTPGTSPPPAARLTPPGLVGADASPGTQTQHTSLVVLYELVC